MVSYKSNLRGFTLFEVLVALSIIAIAMTAVMKVQVQQSRNHLYLEQKIAAHWIALYQIVLLTTCRIHILHIVEIHI